MLKIKNKGAAISTIVYLTIGILLIALVIFLVYTQLTGGTKAIDVNKCTAEKIRLCTICKFGGLDVEKLLCKVSDARAYTDSCGLAPPADGINCIGILPK